MRLTPFILVLAMLSLGSGLSQALHHAIAHAPSAEVNKAAQGCHTHCGSSNATPHDEAPAESSHEPHDCAVCATLATVKTLIPSLLSCAIAPQPTSEIISPASDTAATNEPLRSQRSRAPPAN